MNIISSCQKQLMYMEGTFDLYVQWGIMFSNCSYFVTKIHKTWITYTKVTSLSWGSNFGFVTHMWNWVWFTARSWIFGFQGISKRTYGESKSSTRTENIRDAGNLTFAGVCVLSKDLSGVWYCSYNCYMFALGLVISSGSEPTMS